MYHQNMKEIIFDLHMYQVYAVYFVFFFHIYLIFSSNRTSQYFSNSIETSAPFALFISQSSVTIGCNFDLNPTYFQTGFPVNSSSILPITILLVGS